MAAPLSNLEIRLLVALADGYQSKEISGILNRSKATVEAYVRILFAKFDARSRAHLVGLAIADGIIAAPLATVRPDPAATSVGQHALG
jgi:DNA-binding CsgD family transcriptional regulator